MYWIRSCPRGTMRRVPMPFPSRTLCSTGGAARPLRTPRKGANGRSPLCSRPVGRPPKRPVIHDEVDVPSWDGHGGLAKVDGTGESCSRVGINQA